jgi:hypothetical protein
MYAQMVCLTSVLYLGYHLLPDSPVTNSLRLNAHFVYRAFLIPSIYADSAQGDTYTSYQQTSQGDTNTPFFMHIGTETSSASVTQHHKSPCTH